VGRRDGSSVEYARAQDGYDRPIKVHFPNGTETTYRYDRNGSVTQVSEWGPGGTASGQPPLFTYATRDGRTWQEVGGRGPNIYGQLEVTPQGWHVFHDEQTQTIFVRKPDGSITVTAGQGRPVWGGAQDYTNMGGHRGRPDGRPYYDNRQPGQPDYRQPPPHNRFPSLR
jgi:YD repeat-containing protein